MNEFFNTLSNNLWIFPVPNIVVKMLLDDTDSNVLAKPQLRVMEGKKASVHIGDKLPIATSNQYLSTASTTQSYTPIVSYTYQDIGVKIEIEPKVHHNREVTITLKTEVSSVTGYIKGSALSGDQPIIGTRQVTTTIRLEDGESSLLAGLIRKEDTKAISGLPGVSEIPILRRLFSDTTDHTKKTDVVVLLTPHILRMPNIRDEDVRPLWVGTADRPRLREAAGGFGSPTTPFASSGTPPKEEAKPKERPEDKKEPAAKEAAEKEAPQPPETQPKEAAPAESGSPQAGRLLVSPTNITVPQGTAATLNLVLIGAKNLKGVHLEMDYPSDVLQFQGVDEGTFFKLGGGATSFVARETKPGLVAVDLNRTDGTGASGSGLVARVRFTGQKGGEARANFGVAQATDVSGQATQLPPAFAIISVVASPPPQTGATGGGGG
jgi:general secretion pathway protein D